MVRVKCAVSLSAINEHIFELTNFKGRVSKEPIKTMCCVVMKENCTIYFSRHQFLIAKNRFKNTKKCPPAHAARLFTIYHRREREHRNQSEDGIRDGTLVDLF